ncbi:MAG: hypothetical protein JSU61_07345 [Fidelibacterota bacterium]|nr:MAG: hypothetical protein JSU61_07345 [Candidatus Neomarinimicrobiota bacterium]
MNRYRSEFPAVKFSPRIILLLFVILLAVGCGEKPERHLDLGLWYYQKGLVDDAILEFKEVIRLLPADPRRMSGHELDVVTRAHYNLAVAYARKNWYELALIEAGKTFELRPTPENYELQELIRKRKDLESLNSPATSRPD